jgi:hypothetical protein
VALAQVQLEAAKARQDAAETDEEEDEAYAAYRAAKKALRAAEELPVERTTATMPTGRTYGQAWAEADDDERCHLLLTCLGPAVVTTGRGAIEEKVVWP